MPEAAAVALAAVLIAALWLAATYNSQVALVRRTLEVETKLSYLMSDMQDAEIGRDGYLLTDDQTYLAPYESAIKNIPHRLDALAALIFEPDQEQTLSALRPVIDQRLALLRATVERQSAGDGEGARGIILTHRGKQLMDDVRAKIAAMAAREEELLAARSAAASRTILALAALVALSVVLTALALGAWIFDARRANRELTEAHREIVGALAEREAAEAQVRQLQKMEAVGQLTGGIAHDFNNMLAVIIGGLNLVQRRLARGDYDIAKFLEGALEGASRAAALTRRLLAFSRQQTLAPERLDGNRLVGGMSELLTRTLGETIQTETVLGAGLWPVHADPGQLENALLNLCVNARDAMAGGGKLTIETANCHFDEAYARQNNIPVGQYVLIAVSDTGCGMTADTLARAFDPFFTTKRAGQGTGLGLSQVYGFVKQSNGHIKLYSELGRGTAAKIYLPRFHGSASEPASAKVEPRDVPRGGVNQVILVVEDENRVRELTAAMLRELGYTVVHANGGAEGLIQLDANPGAALLLTDIVMPEMDGRGLADEALRRRPGLKVLFMTGFTRNAVVHNGVLDPGVQLIAKPFTIEDLAAKVDEVLRA